MLPSHAARRRLCARNRTRVLDEEADFALALVHSHVTSEAPPCAGHCSRFARDLKRSIVARERERVASSSTLMSKCASRPDVFREQGFERRAKPVRRKFSAASPVM